MEDVNTYVKLSGLGRKRYINKQIELFHIQLSVFGGRIKKNV